MPVGRGDVAVGFWEGLWAAGVGWLCVVWFGAGQGGLGWSPYSRAAPGGCPCLGRAPALPTAPGELDGSAWGGIVLPGLWECLGTVKELRIQKSRIHLRMRLPWWQALCKCPKSLLDPKICFGGSPISSPVEIKPCKWLSAPRNSPGGSLGPGSAQDAEFHWGSGVGAEDLQCGSSGTRLRAEGQTLLTSLLKGFWGGFCCVEQNWSSKGS